MQIREKMKKMSVNKDRWVEEIEGCCHNTHRPYAGEEITILRTIYGRKWCFQSVIVRSFAILTLASPISTKIRLMKALAWPVGYESWGLRKNEEARLDTFDMERFLRRCFLCFSVWRRLSSFSSCYSTRSVWDASAQQRCCLYSTLSPTYSTDSVNTVSSLHHCSAGRSS